MKRSKSLPGVLPLDTRGLVNRHGKGQPLLVLMQKNPSPGQVCSQTGLVGSNNAAHASHSPHGPHPQSWLQGRSLGMVVSCLPSSIASTCLPWLPQLTKQQTSKNSGAPLAHTLLLTSKKSKSTPPQLRLVMKVPAIRGKLASRPSLTAQAWGIALGSALLSKVLVLGEES